MTEEKIDRPCHDEALVNELTAAAIDKVGGEFRLVRKDPKKAPEISDTFIVVCCRALKKTLIRAQISAMEEGTFTEELTTRKKKSWTWLADRRELLSLQHDALISNFNIEAFVLLLQKERACGNGKFTVLGLPLCLPKNVSVDVDYLAKRHYESLKGVVGEFRTAVEQLLVPVLIEERHWVLLRYCTNRRNVCLLNSIDHPAWRQTLIQRKGEVLTYIEVLLQKQVKWKGKRPIKKTVCEQQQNAVDCGLFVILWMEAEYLGKEGIASVDSAFLRRQRDYLRDNLERGSWRYELNHLQENLGKTAELENKDSREPTEGQEERQLVQ